ncbi:MAG: DUF5363 domain-containing protein [Bacteroidales bacterium]|nr:DUF5363 domain-containing protein [Bacteroidales bacterium]
MEAVMKLECEVSVKGRTFTAETAITGESIVVQEPSSALCVIDFASVEDFRLLDYQVIVHTAQGEWRFSKLGRETENFFEQLWQAYNHRCEEALFVRGNASFEGEGRCAIDEQGLQLQGTAKVVLYDDCLCLYPHDDKARRIPLCFASPARLDDYRLTLRLDTGDEYQIEKLGLHTQDVFEIFCHRRDDIVKRWEQAQRDLTAHLVERLGDAAGQYKTMQGLSCKMIAGIFSLDTEGFWFAGLRDGKAAVELVTNEQTATYLYQYDVDDQVFEYRLRHAMESVALHREVILTDIAEHPLYQMSVHRNYHLQYLRAHHAGRVIHTASWEKQLGEFMPNP